MTRIGAGLRRALILVAAFGLSTCASAPPDKLERTATGTSTAPPVEPTTIRSADGREWHKLAKDGLHDPDNELLQFLQQPAEALGALPTGGPEGNQVDWIAALRDGAIMPLSLIHI